MKKLFAALALIAIASVASAQVGPGTPRLTPSNAPLGTYATQAALVAAWPASQLSTAGGPTAYVQDGTGPEYWDGSAWVRYSTGGASGTVTDVTGVNTHGFSWSIATHTTTPAITLSTTITGLLAGSGGSLAAAAASDVLTLFPSSLIPTTDLSGYGTFAAGITLTNTANAYTQSSTGLSITSGATGFGRDIEGTVNDSTTVDGIIDFANILCTSCTAASTLVDWQVGSVSQFTVTTAGVLTAKSLISTSGLQIASGGAIRWAASGGGIRPGAGQVQLGAANALSPVAQTLSAQGSRGGTDSNVAGASLAIQSGLGTGTGTPSTLSLAVPHVGTTGTTQQTATTQIQVGDYATSIFGALTLAPGNGTGISAPSWTTTGIGLIVTPQTFTDTTSSGTIATEAAYAIGAPTIAASSATTVTSLATLYVAAPVNGTNVTATTKYGIYDAGALLVTGGGAINGITTINQNTNSSVGIASGTSTGVVTIGNSGSTGKTILAGIGTGTNADFLCLSATNAVLLQTSACTISSLRFKLNVEDYQDDALAKIKQLRVATFRMKGTNKDPNYSRQQIGLIAENIAKIEPRCAIYEDDMVTPKSYRQECVIALLVSAMQELQVKQAPDVRWLWLAIGMLALALIACVSAALLWRRS